MQKGCFQAQHPASVNSIRVRTLNIIPLVQAGYSEPQLWGGGGGGGTDTAV